MLGLDARIARYTWTVVFVLIATALVYTIRQTLFVLVVSLLFAYLLWPLVNFLDQRLPGRSRAPALAIVYLALIGMLVILGVVVGTKIAGQATLLANRIPELLAQLEAPPDSTAPQALRTRIFVTARQQIASHSRELLTFVSDAVFRAVSNAENVLYVVLVPILSFFFLKDGRKILRSLLGSLGEGSRRDTMKSIADDLHLLLAEYMRALVMLAAAVFVAYGSFFSLIGVPYGILLGAIAFPFEFIPLVGPLTAGVIVLVVAGVSGYTHLLWIVIFLCAYRLFQDYVLSPYLLSSGTELHPLLVIFGVLAGGQVAGIAGTFLSVPVLATFRIVYRQLSKRRDC